MIAYRHSVIDEFAQGEIFVVARKPFLDRAPEQREVARAGDLIIVRQAGRVDISGVAHAERLGFLRHELGELVLVAGQIFGDRHGDIVRRSRDHGFDRIIDRDGLAGLDAELRWRLLGRMDGDLERRVEPDRAGVEPLEQQVERHDLGQRSRMAQRVGVRRLEHLAGVAVDDDRGRRR